MLMKKLIEEKGSISVYVFIVLFSFLVIISTIYASSASVRKSQLETVIKIKESYEQDNKNIEEIYQKASNKTYVTDGLVLHYDAIDNAGTGEHSSTTTTWNDLSGNGNDGALQNFAMDSTSGWTEDGLQFNGSTSYVSAINPMFDEVGGSPNMTVEVISIKQNAKYEAVLSFTQIVNDHTYMDLWTTVEDNRGYEVSYRYDSSQDANSRYSRTEYPLNKSIAITYGLDSEKFFSYANGRDKKTITRIEGVGWDTDKLYLGRPISDNYYFSGIIRSVRIYNRALTEEEIQQNYQVDKVRFNLE